MTTKKTWLAAGAGLGAVGLALFGLTIFDGVVSVAGTDEHTPPVRWLLKTTMERSVPPGLNLQDRELAQRGYGHYQVPCTPWTLSAAEYQAMGQRHAAAQKSPAQGEHAQHGM
jgi:hypothetical protein